MTPKLSLLLFAFLALIVCVVFAKEQDTTEFVASTAATVALTAAVLGYTVGRDHRRDDDELAFDPKSVDILSDSYIRAFACKFHALPLEEQQAIYEKCVAAVRSLDKPCREEIVRIRRAVAEKAAQLSASSDQDLQAEETECAGICTTIAVVGGLAAGYGVGRW